MVSKVQRNPLHSPLCKLLKLLVELLMNKVFVKSMSTLKAQAQAEKVQFVP
jgi:hypothetical protein